MARKRSLTSTMFQAARLVDDVETARSGNPRRIARRAKNIAVGRLLFGRRGIARRIWS